LNLASLGGNGHRVKLRALGYLAGACILHVAAFGLVARLHVPAPAPVDSALAATTPLEIEIDRTLEPEAREVAPVDVGSSLHATAPAGAKVAPRAGSVSPEGEQAPVATSESPSSLPAQAAPADSGSWSFPSTRPTGVPLGDLLGNKGIVIAPGAGSGAAVAEAPPARGISKSGGLVEGLDQADFAKGQGRGGAVLASVEAAARSNDAPTIGRVVFDVTVDRANVVTVSVVSASEDFRGWSNLAGAIATGVRSRKTRIPPGAQGLRVRVEVDAAVKYPDGRDVRSTGGFVDPEHLTIGTQGKVCGIGLNPLGISGGCSPENIGGVAARIVHGRVLGESRLD
jgi:hypothetical protein